jgi:ubiquinol-cytochrome c reductase subunit 6
MASKIQNENDSVVDKFIPSVKAEEEDEPEEEEEEEDEEDLIDPAVEIKEKCGEDHCSKYKNRLDECNDRVTSKSKTTETCFEEILDFYHCVDHCAAEKIFSVLK